MAKGPAKYQWLTKNRRQPSVRHHRLSLRYRFYNLGRIDLMPDTSQKCDAFMDQLLKPLITFARGIFDTEEGLIMA